MTLGECAKFLIRLARQPEAAAAPPSLHGLFALQHNKPLYSFEDNADYVYDVMWSPVHPALFACVDGMGRLDLWNLNNDTEVSGGAGARAGGLGGGRSSRPLSVSPALSCAALFWMTLQWQLGSRPPVSTALKGIGRCTGQKSFHLTPSPTPGRSWTIDDPLQKSKTLCVPASPSGKGHTGTCQSGAEITLLAGTWKSQLLWTLTWDWAF